MENDKNSLHGIEDNKLPNAEVTEHVMDNVLSMVSMDTCSKTETLDASCVSIAEDNTLPIAEETGHVMDDAQTMVSMGTCSKAETLGASTVSIAEELCIESSESDRDGHGHLSKALQGHGMADRALCALESNESPSVEVKEHAMVEPRHVQNDASTSTSSEAETLVTPTVIDIDNLSIESNGFEKDDNQHNDLSADKKVHGMDSSMVRCGVTEDDESSYIANTVEDALQEHEIERNTVACGVVGDDDSSDFASKVTCTDIETLDDQSGLISNAKKNDGEENDHQHSFLVSPSGNEDISDDLPCCKAISDLEKMRAILLETELHGNIDVSLSNGESVESHDPVFEMEGLGEDKETKAGVKSPISDFVAEASEKVQSVSEYQVPDVTDCRHAESCHQENSRLVNENSETGDLRSPAVLLKPEATQDEDAKHELLAVNENARSDNSGGADALLSQYGKEHTIHSAISSSLLNTEDEAKSIAQVSESGDLVSRPEDIPEVGSMKPEHTAIDVKSDGISNGSLEVLTYVLDTVEISNLAHRESAVDEDCPLAAGQAPSMKCSSPSSSIRFPIVQVRDMDDNNLHVQCSEGNKLVGMDFGVCQTGGTASNETQLHGYTVDKDGGSSVDSTAGTGWKLQGADGCIVAEDEEASSTGGEDSASSPAFLQPSTQQRKKINIHHQFVREIVKIQHGREQYDREQAERQIQAQQAVSSAQLGGKSLDSKGLKVDSSDSKQLRSEMNKIPSQRGPKDHGDDRNTESQQKHATRNKKSLLVQVKDGSSHQKIAPQESSEHGRQSSFLQGRDLLGAKEHGKTGRGRQQRYMSIYRPPIVRDSLAAGELETSYHQSGTYAINSSPDSSTSSVSEPHVPIVGSPNLLDDEGTLKVARSSSGECYVHNRETQADQCTPGMGIKVTFDTERKLRHIEFSDLPGRQRQNDRVNIAASHSSSSFRMSKSPIINPLLSHPYQESKSSYIDKRQAGIGEVPSKANDRYFTQADRSSLLQGPPSESSQFRGKIGRASDNNIERKNSFFEQADNSAILHNSSGWLHNSPSLARHGNNGGLSGPNIYSSDNVRHAEGHSGDIRTPSVLLQGFNTPRSLKSSSLGPSNKGELSAAASHSSPYTRSDEPNRTPGNFQASPQPQAFNISRSKHDLKGKQKLTISSDGSNKKRDLQLRNSIKESGSPFHAMMKDSNRPQVMFSSPSPQSSGNASLDIQGFGMSWDVEDQVHIRNQDSSYEGLKRTQSDASRKGSTQNLQAQSSLLPSREGFFSTMPMQEKWGDIVDDQYDSYDYLQLQHEGERESHSGSLSYGGNIQSSAAFVDAANLKPEKKLLRDSKQNKVLRKYGHSETGSLQRTKAASELLQDHSAFETPVRKSVFERLGPPNNFKESILGPPPKVLDSRGVLRASPDAIISNTPPVSTFKSFDTGFHGSQQAAHLSSMLHDTGDNMTDEGREVVVQAYTELKQRRSKRELYVPRRGS